MEGAAALDHPVRNSPTLEKSLTVAELEHAIADVHRILEIVGEQVRVLYSLGSINDKLMPVFLQLSYLTQDTDFLPSSLIHYLDINQMCNQICKCAIVYISS